MAYDSCGENNKLSYIAQSETMRGGREELYHYMEGVCLCPGQAMLTDPADTRAYRGCVFMEQIVQEREQLIFR